MLYQTNHLRPKSESLEIGGQFADVPVTFLNRCAEGQQLVVALKDGGTSKLQDNKQFIGFQGEAKAPTSVLLEHNGLHIDIIINRATPIGKNDAAGVADVVLEAALSTILDLEDSVAAVDAADGCDPGFCPFPHTVSTLDDRIGIPGTPCACLVVLVAAWNSVVSWVTHRADQQLIATVAARPVQFQLSPDRGDFGALTDPAVDEIAPGLRVSPGSAHHRVGGVRRLFAVPELRGAVASGLVTAFLYTRR